MKILEEKILNLNLTPQDVADVKSAYDAWEEIGDRAKELSAEKKAILQRASVIYECKPGMVGRLFKNMKQKMDEGESEIDQIVLMEETVRNNGE